MATYRYTKFVDKTNPRKQRRFIKKAEVDNLYLYYKNIAVTDCCTMYITSIYKIWTALKIVVRE